MTEGYPPQWQNDVQADGAPLGDVAGEGRHGAAGGYNAPTGGAFGADVSTSSAYADSSFDTGASDDSPGKAGAAKEQAAAVGQGAADAGQHVASVAKDQAQNVVAEAGAQTKDLLNQARSELTDQAGAQQQRLAQGLRALGDELHAMTQHSESPGVATDLAKQAATRSHDAASWLESREPGSLMSELQSFARQRPGAFLALAAGAGLVAGRLGRGVKDASSDDTSGSTPTYTPAAAPAPSYYSSPGTAYTPGVAPTGGIAGDPVGYGTPESRPFASSQDSGYSDIRGVGESL